MKKTGWIKMFIRRQVFFGILISLLLSTNVKSQWVNQAVNNVVYSYMTVYMADSLTGWIGGFPGSILKTTDGGSSWHVQFSDSGQTGVNQIKFLDKEIGFAVEDQETCGALLKTTNGGDTWTIDSSLSTIASDSVFAMGPLFFTASGDSTLLGVGCLKYTSTPTRRYIYFSKDEGHTWTYSRNFPVSESLIYGIVSPAPATMLLWSGPSIFRTVNSGDTWQQVQTDSAGNYPIVTVRFMNPDTGYFIAWNGQNNRQPTRIGWTFDRGGTWTIDSTQSPVVFTPYYAYFVTTSLGFGFGNNSSIFRTTDAGKTWQEEKFSSFAPLTDMCSAGGRTVVGAGDGGRLIVSNDSGITWQDLTPPEKIQLTFVKYLSNDLIAAIGNGYELFLSSDSCKTWTKHDMPSGLNVTIAFGDSLNCWIADDSSRIFHSSDLGATWTVQKEFKYPMSTLDPSLYGISFFNDSIGCAVGGNGFITATTNGGSTWVTRTSNTAKNLYGIFVASPRKAWAVGQSGTIITTSDAFNSWSAQVCPVTATLRSVVFSDTLNGYILGDGGTILKTTDGGTTWKVQPSPGASLNAVKFLNASQGWVAADSGKIFETSDGGGHWLNQTTAVQSSLTSVDFADRLHGVAVGGSGVILVTKNGGVTAVIERTNALVPGKPELQQNYPNPFNPSTVIDYSLPGSSHVILKIYDVLGREVRTLVDVKQNAGSHNIIFQAADLPSGVYFYRLQAGAYSETKKLLLLK